MQEISPTIPANSCSPCEAELVREGLPQKELEKVRRMLVEYGLSGWDMTYILPADKELHERIKKKENFC